MSGCAHCHANGDTWLFRRSEAREPNYYCEACIRSSIGDGCYACSRVTGHRVSHPGLCPVAEGHRLVMTPHVATLPDGSTVNLPAGTVLREGTAEQASPMVCMSAVGFVGNEVSITFTTGCAADPMGEALVALLKRGTCTIADLCRTLEAPQEAPREATPEENFAALKRMYPDLAAVHERAAAKRGVQPWDVTDEMLWEECPALRPEAR